MLDIDCDHCKKPMAIRRNSKNARVLVCENPECKRRKRTNPQRATLPSPAPALVKGINEESKPKRSAFSLGW